MMAGASPPRTSGAVPMFALAALGLFTAKILAAAVRLIEHGGDGLWLLATLSGFPVDVLLLIWVAALGAIAHRVAPRLVARVGPWAGAAIGAHAIGFTAVEVGGDRPGFVAAIAITGLAILAVGGWFAVRDAQRFLLARGPRALTAMLLYSVTALAFLQANPRLASIYGLHHSPLADQLGATWTRLGGPTAQHVPALGSEPAFPKPDGSHWTRTVRYNTLLRPRHVVVWLASATGAAQTSLHNPRVDTTPHLRRLAAHGLRFTQHYANAPSSFKSLFTVLCGLHPYPDRALLTRVNPRIDCPSLMGHLTERGYTGAYFTGKRFAHGDQQKFLSERGFDLTVDADSVDPGLKAWTHRGGVDDAAIVAEALRWLDGRDDPSQPTFVVMAPSIPQAPYDLPPSAAREETGGSAKARHRNAIRYADAQLGALHDGYAARGLAAETLFVYVSDHGEPHEAHPGNNAAGKGLYEENVEVPLVFINERLFPKETVSHRLGSHVDILPTVLDLLGETPPDALQGQSLVDRDFAYRPVFLGAYQGDRLGGLRDGRYKYVYNYASSTEVAFDLTNDPKEQQDILATLDPNLVVRWRQWVLDHHALQKVMLRNHLTLGETYLERIARDMEVSIVDADAGQVCERTDGGAGRLCAGMPEHMTVKPGRAKLAGITRECLLVHPPERGALQIEVPAQGPPPAFVAAALTDTARRAGGAPVEVAVQIGTRDAFTLTLENGKRGALQSQRLSPSDEPATVTITVRADTTSDRQTCLVMWP